jgi:monoamine oxidase
MKRRKFLYQTGMALGAAALLPFPLLPSCRRSVELENVNKEGRVLVVGAGAAGLYTTYLLAQQGLDVVLLEAASTHGGRLGKRMDFADYPIDTGAQWMHGRNNLPGQWARDNGTVLTRDNNTLSYWFDGSLVNSLPSNPFFFEGNGRPDISYLDYGRQQGLDERYDWIVEALAGNYGADASELSVYWSNKEEENWSSGSGDYKFERTYFDLIHERIAVPILDKIQYECAVEAIDYSAETIKVSDTAGRVWEADQVVLAVPITLLKDGVIRFTPQLPEDRRQALQRIGMGPGMKVFLKFSEKFYRNGLYGGPLCAAYWNDTVGKNTSENVLLAFVMGEQAAYLNSLGSDEAITSALLGELDMVYGGQASPTFLASSVHNPSANPYIRGAYSFSTIGMGNARSLLAQPLNNKLFFAGEAMNTRGHHQTVQGAVESGEQAVMDLLVNRRMGG